MKDTKKKSLNKTASWRLIAVINSWAVLALVVTEKAWINAVLMNISGAVLYYLHERVWAKRDETKTVK